jgi:hypothetical protein
MGDERANFVSLIGLARIHSDTGLLAWLSEDGCNNSGALLHVRL